ncbi:hypothetical protein H4S03_004254, partial [Coemansia sp. S3946]
MDKSIGVASVAGYILGLGDRHLGNSLVSDNGLVNIEKGLFALSQVFKKLAIATWLFARMYRHMLVAGISRRVLFRSFMEWTTLEESWLRDRSIDRWHGGSAEALMPCCMPLATTALWSQAHVVSAEDFVCPLRTLWLRSAAEQAVIEIPYGWRIAHGAVAHVDARLDYRGIGGTRS